jgi:hypothetical protein
MGAEAALMYGAMCRLGIAAILAQSAWHALSDPSRHAAAISGYRLLPYRAVPAAAWAFPLLSLSAAALLPWSATAASGLVLAISLITAFTVAIAINLRRGRIHIDCGCGGADGQRISRGLVLRNLVLLAMLTTSLLAPAPHATDPFTVAVELAGGAAIAALYFAASQLLANHAAIRAEMARA